MGVPKYIIEFDDGTTEEVPFEGQPSQEKLNAATREATQRWQARQKAAAAQPQNPPAGDKPAVTSKFNPISGEGDQPSTMNFEDYLNHIKQGATFNTSDEYDAAIDTLAEKVTGKRQPTPGETGMQPSNRGWGEAWSALHKGKNDRLNEMRQEHPWKTSAMEFAGSAPQMLIPGGGRGYWGGIGQGMKTGGITGAVSGAGAATSEGQEEPGITDTILQSLGPGGMALSALGSNRRTAAIAGGIGGMVGGGAIPAFTGAVSRGLQGIVNARPDSAISRGLQRLGGVGATGTAGRLWNSLTGAEAPQNAARKAAVAEIVDALRKNRLTVDEAEQHLSALGEGGFLADLVPDLSGTAMRHPSVAKEEVTRKLTQRASEAGERLGGSIRTATDGIQKNAGQITDMLTREQETTARNAYQSLWRAYPGPVNSGTVANILDMPKIKAMYADVVENMRMRDQPVGELPTLQALDNLKKKIWHAADNADPDSASALKKVYGDLVGFLDMYTGGDYANVRRTFSDPAALKDLIEAGGKYRKLEPAQITARLADLNEVEQRAYRTGAIKHLYDVVDETKGNRAVYNSLSRGERDRLHALFPSDDAMFGFMNQVRREKVFKRTGDVALGGSATAEREAQKKAFQVDPTMDFVDSLRSGKGIIGTTVGMGAQRLRERALQDKAGETLSLLYDPVRGLDTVRRVQEQMNRPQAIRPKFAPGIIGRSIGTGIGSKIGQ
jgi:hypothetical protein